MTENSEGLPRSSWRASLDALTKQHEGDEVTIEVPSTDLGDQYEAEKVPFGYLEYDEHDDMVNVGIGGRDGRYPVVLRHAIEHPQRLFIDLSASDAGSTVGVVGSDGVETIITLHRRPALPA